MISMPLQQRSQQHATHILVIILFVMLPQSAVAMPSSALKDTVNTVADKLNRVWTGSLLNVPNQPPEVEIVQSGLSLNKVCTAAAGPKPSQAAAGSSAPTDALSAMYCPASHRVLVDSDLMTDTLDLFDNGGVSFWLSRGFAAALLASRQPEGSPASAPAILQASRTRNLRTTCIAGNLLGLLPGSRAQPPERTLRQALKAVLADFDPAAAASQGTQAQRAYALLTGTGATKLTCGDADMLLLATKPSTLPDRELFHQFAAFLRAPSVGIEVFCRTPPQPTCPRPLDLGQAAGGI